MRLQPHQLRALREHEQSGNVSGFIMPPRIQPKKRSREESEMQCALIKWWALKCRSFGVPEILLFSIPNGGGRSGPIIGKLLKNEGLRKGAPDLMLSVSRQYHGLFLELKRPDGIVSPEQEAFHAQLRFQGYKVAVCRSLNECINQITGYLTQ